MDGLKQECSECAGEGWLRFRSIYRLEAQQSREELPEKVSFLTAFSCIWAVFLAELDLCLSRPV